MTKDDFINSIKTRHIDDLFGLTDIDDPLFINVGRITDSDIHRDDDIVPETLYERISLFNQMLGERWACVEFQIGEQQYCVWTSARGDQSMFLPYVLNNDNAVWHPFPIIAECDSNEFRFEQTLSKLDVALPPTGDIQKIAKALTMLPVALAEAKVRH